METFFYIVEIDRVEYSKTAKTVKEILGIEGLALLNDQTQSYIDLGLKAVGRLRDEFVLPPCGDNSTILFNNAVLVHNFAKAIHDHTVSINNTLDAEHRCWFRIGCGYDEVFFKDGRLGLNPASYGRAIANRLCSAARPGELLIDLETYAQLPTELKEKYGSEEKVKIKDHDESFVCHRWIKIPNVEKKQIAEGEEIKKKKLKNDYEICKTRLLSEPDNLNLLKERTYLATKLEDIEEVESTVNEASLIAPNQHYFLVLNGDLFFNLKEYEDAIIFYHKAIGVGLGRKDYKVWLKLGRSHFLIEDYAVSIDFYKEALILCRDSPDDYLICCEYAKTLEKLNRHHESIQLYNSSLCLQSNYRASSYERRRTYQKIYS